MKSLLTILFSLLVVSCFAQDGDIYIFKGNLKSKLRKEDVPYAAVSLINKKMGVVANDKGQFELHIPKASWNDSVEIQAMGFITWKEHVNNLLKTPQHTIFLADTVYNMTEVVVSSISPREIVLRAFERSETNFPTSPYEMECFYRNTVKEDGKYVKLLESLYKAYDRGFTHGNNEAAVDLSHAVTRQSKDYSNPEARLPYPFFRPQWLLTIENYARNKQQMLKNIKRSVYEFEFESPKYLNGKMIYIIDAKVKDEIKDFIFDMKFYIREKDYAFVQIDFDGGSKLEYLRPQGMPQGLKVDVLAFRNTYVFKEHEGKMYMHYLNDFASYDWYRNKKRLSHNEENGQVIIQNISFPPGGKATFPFFPKRRFAALIPTNYASEKEKWNNDLVNQIPFDSAIKTDLEKEMSLEDQFLKKYETAK